MNTSDLITDEAELAGVYALITTAIVSDKTAVVSAAKAVMIAVLDTLFKEGVICKRPSREQIENAVTAGLEGRHNGRNTVLAIEKLLDGENE